MGVNQQANVKWRQDRAPVLYMPVISRNLHLIPSISVLMKYVPQALQRILVFGLTMSCHVMISRSITLENLPFIISVALQNPLNLSHPVTVKL